MTNGCRVFHSHPEFVGCLKPGLQLHSLTLSILPSTSSCCLLLPSTPPPAPPPPPPPPPRPPAAGAPPLLRQPPRRRLTPRTLSRPAANGRRRAGVWCGSPRGLDSGASRRGTGLLPRSLPSFPPSSTSSYWSDTVLGELLLARHRLKAVGPMGEQGGGWRNT